jgi:tetrahydromethanopterin S-methyltransferase subunit B
MTVEEQVVELEAKVDMLLQAQEEARLRDQRTQQLLMELTARMSPPIPKGDTKPSREGRA